MINWKIVWQKFEEKYRKEVENWQDYDWVAQKAHIEQLVGLFVEVTQKQWQKIWDKIDQIPIVSTWKDSQWLIQSEIELIGEISETPNKTL